MAGFEEDATEEHSLLITFPLEHVCQRKEAMCVMGRTYGFKVVHALTLL
jgi:hypothetical protein